MTKLAETCACGAQFSADDDFHSAKGVWEELDKWRREHLCPLRLKLAGQELALEGEA